MKNIMITISGAQDSVVKKYPKYMLLQLQMITK